MRSCCSGIRMYSLVMSSSADRLRFEYAPGTTAEPLLPEASSATRFDFRHTCTRRARASAAAPPARCAPPPTHTALCARRGSQGVPTSSSGQPWKSL